MPETKPQTEHVPNLAILISGQGSNMQVILEKIREGELPACATLVFSDVREAPGLEIAREAGVLTETFSPKEFESFREYESRLVTLLKKEKIEWVICAGYMRLLRKQMLEAFKNHIINIHPSLLPAFPGLDAQKQALNSGVKIAGCTVHFVDEGVDTGPIILQSAVPVYDGDTLDELSARIRKAEHETFWKAIKLAINGYRPARSRIPGSS